MRRRSCKVFIKLGVEPTPFMWVDQSSDGSVMMGLLGEVAEEIELAGDGQRGELRPPTLIAEPRVGPSKITFHRSGLSKLGARMGLDATTMDRATTLGPALSEIVAPRRMLEMILPSALPESRLTPTDRDIVLTADEIDGRPLRCSVSCMALDQIQKVVDSGVFFVETSLWETTGVLENGSHAWTWTLRVSRNDPAIGERNSRVHICLPGLVKWGQSPPAEGADL